MTDHTRETADERVAHSLDTFLGAVARLFDQYDRLSAGLQKRGFSAFGPDLWEEHERGGTLWIAHREIAKETLCRRSVRLLDTRKVVGYVSPILPELYKSVGIGEEESQESGSSARLLEALRSQARERGSLEMTVDDLIHACGKRAYQEAEGALVTAGLDDLPGSRRTKQFLKSRFGDRDYRVAKRRTMFSSQVMSKSLGSVAALEIVIPRPGPASNNYLPRRNPRIVRPQFDAEDSIPEELAAGLLNNDWVTAIDLGYLVPGFLAYNLTISWDLYIHGLDAFCTLFDLVEANLIEATMQAASVLVGTDG